MADRLPACRLWARQAGGPPALTAGTAVFRRSQTFYTASKEGGRYFPIRIPHFSRSDPLSHRGAPLHRGCFAGKSLGNGSARSTFPAQKFAPARECDGAGIGNGNTARRSARSRRSRGTAPHCRCSESSRRERSHSRRGSAVHTRDNRARNGGANGGCE